MHLSDRRHLYSCLSPFIYSGVECLRVLICGFVFVLIHIIFGWLFFVFFSTENFAIVTRWCFPVITATIDNYTP